MAWRRNRAAITAKTPSTSDCWHICRALYMLALVASFTNPTCIACKSRYWPAEKPKCKPRSLLSASSSTPNARNNESFHSERPRWMLTSENDFNYLLANIPSAPNTLLIVK
jgi:hypothetical protein